MVLRMLLGLTHNLCRLFDAQNIDFRKFNEEFRLCMNQELNF